MPELPEVETVCRGLAAVLVGERVAALELRRQDMRFPFPPGLKARVEGRVVAGIERRAKYILIRLDDGAVLIAHLGMAGRLLLGTGIVEPGPHDHVVILTEGGASVRFNDARRFGFLDLAESADLAQHRMLRALGPEPLDDSFTGAFLAARIAGKMTSIKAALLDQKIVAGLGNIYVSEALYEARLSPRRLATSVQGARADRLVAAIKDVLSRAIAAGGSSLRDYVQASGELGYFQHQWAVYGREGLPCPQCRCAFGVKRFTQSNRSTFIARSNNVETRGAAL